MYFLYLFFSGGNFGPKKKFNINRKTTATITSELWKKKNCHAIQFSDHMKIFRHVCSSLLFLIFAQRNKQIVASSLQLWLYKNCLLYATRTVVLIGYAVFITSAITTWNIFFLLLKNSISRVSQIVLRCIMNNYYLFRFVAVICVDGVENRVYPLILYVFCLLVRWVDSRGISALYLFSR